MGCRHIMLYFYQSVSIVTYLFAYVNSSVASKLFNILRMFVLFESGLHPYLESPRKPRSINVDKFPSMCLPLACQNNIHKHPSSLVWRNRYSAKQLSREASVISLHNCLHCMTEVSSDSKQEKVYVLHTHISIDAPGGKRKACYVFM